MYEFLPPIRLLAMVPTSGTVSGEVPVHIYGSGFSRRAANLGYLRCLFGNASVVADMRSNTELVCVTPRGKPGLVPVHITNNLYDWNKAALWFEYQLVRLREVLPDNGPAAGGTVLTVRGDGFVANAIYGTWCRFHHGDTLLSTAEALFINTGEVVCVTPPLPDQSHGITSELSLALSGRSTLDTLVYHFLVTLVIDTAHPMVGPIQGGTTVVVDGQHFSANSFCQFGPAGVVPAQFISTRRIQCVSPSHSVGYVPVSVSSNNQNFFGVVDQFEYTQFAVLVSAFPESGPVDGGTYVSVFGENFHERSASLFSHAASTSPALRCSSQRVR